MNILNMLFTGLFTVEMILKLIAFKPRVRPYTHPACFYVLYIIKKKKLSSEFRFIIRLLCPNTQIQVFKI